MFDPENPLLSTRNRGFPVLATVVLIALVVVGAGACNKSLPENWLPMGQTLGQQEKLDDGHIRQRSFGLAETVGDAGFFAREAACISVLNLRVVKRQLDDMRAIPGEWRALVLDATEVQSETESVASKRGGVRVDVDVIIDTRKLATGVRDLAARFPAQTRPAKDDDDEPGDEDDGLVE